MNRIQTVSLCRQKCPVKRSLSEVFRLVLVLASCDKLTDQSVTSPSDRMNKISLAVGRFANGRDGFDRLIGGNAFGPFGDDLEVALYNVVRGGKK